MDGRPKLSLDIISRALGHLDQGDPITAVTYNACGLAGSELAVASRRINPLFRSVVLRTVGEMDTFYNFSTARTKPSIVNIMQHVVIDGKNLRGVSCDRCNDIIALCTQTNSIDITGVTIRALLSNVQYSTHHVILEAVTFQSGTTITDFLKGFKCLDTLSMRNVEYGRLEEFSEQLPSTLKTLCIHMPKTGDGRPMQDDLVAWMARYPEKIPDIEHFHCMRIGEEHVEHVILVLSCLKRMLKEVTLTMRQGEGVAQTKILAYVISNDLPVRVFRGSIGEDRNQAFDSFVQAFDSFVQI